jgi:hypothetical protein
MWIDSADILPEIVPRIVPGMVPEIPRDRVPGLIIPRVFRY